MLMQWRAETTVLGRSSVQDQSVFVIFFCRAYREEGSETRIEEVYKHLGWVQNRSLTLLDVQIVLETLKGTLSHSIKHVKIRRKIRRNPRRSIVQLVAINV